MEETIILHVLITQTSERYFGDLVGFNEILLSLFLYIFLITLKLLERFLIEQCRK